MTSPHTPEKPSEKQKILPLLSEEEIFARQKNDTPPPQSTNKEEREEQQIFSFRRILHICGSFAVAAFLITITVFFEADASIDKEKVNLLRPNGTVEYSLYSDTFIMIQNTTSLFGGEHIQVISGSADIAFFDGTRLKIKEGAEIFIQQVEPYPSIVLQKGDVWMLGLGESEIVADGVRFLPRGASLALTLQEKKVHVSTYRHSLFMDIPIDENHIRIFLPEGQKAMFTPSNLPKTLSHLRYSKIKKELRISPAKNNEEVQKYIALDTRWSEKKFTTIVLQQRTQQKNRFANILHLFSLYPEKQRKNIEEEEAKKREYAIYQFLFEKKGEQSLASLSDANIVHLLTVLRSSSIQDISLVGMKQILTEAEKRISISNFTKAQTVFSLFENALSEQERDAAEVLLQHVVMLWNNKKQNEGNMDILEMYREVLTNAMQKHMSQITKSMFQNIMKLDELAMLWNPKEKDIIALETIDRNIESANTFLKREEFENADIVLQKNDILLETKPRGILLAKYKKIKEKNELMHAKYRIFREKGVLSDTDFKKVLTEKKYQQEEVEKIYLAQEKYLETETKIMKPNANMSMEEKTKKDFQEENIRIVQMHTVRTEDEEFMSIDEAILPSGIEIRAEYLPKEKIIRKVQTTREDVGVQGEISLGNVDIAISSLWNSNGKKAQGLAEITEELRDTWAQKKDDPLKDVDPLVIDMTRKIILQTISEHGFETVPKNIVMVSKDEVEVREMIIPKPKKMMVAFTVNTKTQTLHNTILLPSQMPFQATTWEELPQKAHEAFEVYKAQQEEEKYVLRVLKEANVEKKKGEVTRRGANIVFQNMRYNGASISGTANAQRKIFLVFRVNGQEIQKNIPFSKLKKILESYQEATHS